MEKSCRKYAPNASPLPPFFGKEPKAVRNSFKSKIFGKGIIKNL